MQLQPLAGCNHSRYSNLQSWQRPSRVPPSLTLVRPQAAPSNAPAAASSFTLHLRPGLAAQPLPSNADSARLAKMQQRLEKQQRPVHSFAPAPDAEGRAKQLTADISHKRHWTSLHNLWLDNAAFSPIHLTATLCRLARQVQQDGIAASDRPEVFKFSSALLSAVRESLPQLDARGIAQCLWAYAKLQSAVPHSSSSGDAAAASLAATLLLGGHLQQLHRSQFAQACWAAATLQARGMPLPSGWWAAVEEQMLQLLPQLNPLEAASCAWAVTKSGRGLPATVTAALQHHVVSAADAYKARELLQVMLALGASGTAQQQLQQDLDQLQPMPGRHQQQLLAAQSQQGDHLGGHSSTVQVPSWLAACYTRLHQQAPYMSAHEVSTALLALSRMGARNAPQLMLSCSHHHQLPVALSTRLLKRAIDTLPSSSPRALATMAYALAKLQLNPGPWWWASWLPYAAAALHVCSPSMLAVMAWSLAKLGVHPGDGWIQELLQHSGFKAQGFGAQEWSMLSYALGRWRACPDLWWWAAFENATQHMLSYFTAAELAALLSGMGSTGPPPPAQQQQLQQMLGVPTSLLQQQQQWQLAAGSLQPEGDVDSADAAVDYIPSGAWTAAMLVAVQKALSGAPGGVLGGIAMGLAKLAVHPSSSWLGAFEAAVLHALPQASLREAAAVLWGLSVMGEQPSRALVQAVDVRVMAVLEARPPAAAVAGQASGPAAGMASADWQQWSSLIGSSAHVLPPPAVRAGRGAPSVADAAQLLWSVARLPEPEGVAAWADDLLTAVLPSPAGASQQSLFVLLRSLAWLRHAPGNKQWVDVWWQAYAQHLTLPAAAAAAPGMALRHQRSGAPAAAGCSAAGSPAERNGCHQQWRQQRGYLLLEEQQAEQQLKKLQFSPAAEQACQQLTVVLWCFKQLRVRPSARTGWLGTLAAVTQPLLHQVSGERFSLLLSAMAQLHVWPGEGWLAAAEGVLRQQQPHMSAQQVQQTAASMRMLGWGALDALTIGDSTVTCE